MAFTTFQLKYSNTNTAPLVLTTGEPAYSNVSGKLFIGGNTDNSIITIGGKYYTDIIDAASNAAVAGTLVKRAANGAVFASAVHSTLYGNAGTATTWENPRLIGVSGDATGRVSVDGSNNANIPLVLTSTGVSAATYGGAGIGTAIVPTITVDSKGRITSAANIALDVNSLVTLNVKGDYGANSITVGRDVLTIKGTDGIETIVVNSNSTILLSGALLQDNWVRTAANSASRYANGAFIQANAAYELTNSAYAYAFVASYTSNSASRYANGAFTQANAAFEVANNASLYAGPASIKANAAFAVANSASSYANAAFLQANSAYIHVNSSYNLANSAALYANGAFVQANGASLYANGAFELANLIFARSNTSSSYANSAFESANNSAIIASGAFRHANSAYNLVNVAIRQANTGFDVANLAYDKANSGYTLAQGAYNTANGKFSSSGGTISGDIVMTGNITPLTDVRYYLGSPTRKWHSLYVGPGSVDIDGVILSADANGTLQVTNPTYSGPVSINLGGVVLATTGTGGLAISNNYDANNITTFVIDLSGEGQSVGGISEQANSAGSYANSAFLRANNSLDANNGGTITGDVQITGNLVITGNVVYANTQTVLITDNIITLNAAIDQSGQPLYNAGIEVDRGAQPNAQFLWIETSGKWAANNGNNSIFIASDAAESYANAAFSQANAAFNRANNSINTVSNYNFANDIFGVVNNVTTLRFDNDTGVFVSDLGDGAVRIRLASSFKTWDINGGPGLVAFGEDSINLVTANGISITANQNASPKILTFDGSIIFDAANSKLSNTGGTLSGNLDMLSSNLTANIVIANTIIAGIIDCGIF